MAITGMLEDNCLVSVDKRGQQYTWKMVRMARS